MVTGEEARVEYSCATAVSTLPRPWMGEKVVDAVKDDPEVVMRKT